MAVKDKSDNPSLKNPDVYDALRKEGHSKEASARISNAQANKAMHPSKKGGKAPPYEEWTRQDLYDRAKELDIDNRSKMSKRQLIDALRDR